VDRDRRRQEGKKHGEGEDRLRSRLRLPFRMPEREKSRVGRFGGKNRPGSLRNMNVSHQLPCQGEPIGDDGAPRMVDGQDGLGC